MKRYLLSLLLMGLSACSSKPLDVNYYVLSPPQATGLIVPNHDAKQIKVNKILLADYLKQSSIALQIDDNKMYFSRQDVWAENLETAILNTLLRDLNQDPDTQYTSYQTPSQTKESTSLTLQIEYLHATDKSTVVSSGRYWLFDPLKQQQLQTPFYFSLPLKQDGYSHAVSQQRQLIRLIAIQIRADLEKLNTVNPSNDI